MSEKSMEFMKKVLEQKKEKQNQQLGAGGRPQKKIGNGQSAFKNQKTGGAKKV